jgi:small subunit ribosomal protein S18
MDKLLKRPWKVGEVYAPHDMSAAEQRKWRQFRPTTVDCFDILNVDPLTLYKVRRIAISPVEGLG